MCLIIYSILGAILAGSYIFLNTTSFVELDHLYWWSMIPIVFLPILIEAVRQYNRIKLLNKYQKDYGTEKERNIDLENRFNTSLKDCKRLENEIVALKKTAHEYQERYGELQTQLDQMKIAYDDSAAKLQKMERDKVKDSHQKDINEQVITLLSLLQQKGRFLDFTLQDITQFDDAKVGGAARIIHQGCSEIIAEYLEVSPIHNSDEEGSIISLPANEYNPTEYRLLGKVSDNPMIKGRLLHAGWRTERIDLPQKTDCSTAEMGVIAPAQIEVIE